LCGGAGELEELGKVTVEVTDHIETKVQCRYSYIMGQCIVEATRPGCGHQYPLDCLGHAVTIGEGPTDGQELVIGHVCLQETVHPSKKVEEEKLFEAGSIWNCMLVGQETTQR
jgi:hypothetical protein